MNIVNNLERKVLSIRECEQLAQHCKIIIDVIAGFYGYDFDELELLHEKFLQKLDPIDQGTFTLEHLYYCLGQILVTSHK